MPAGLKVGAGVGGGMASSGLFSCSAFGSSRKKPGDVPHPAPSQSAGAVPSADSLSSASGRETSYLAALCTNTPPTRGLPSWVSLARDSSSAPLAKTRNATPIPIMVVVLDRRIRPTTSGDWASALWVAIPSDKTIADSHLRLCNARNPKADFNSVNHRSPPGFAPFSCFLHLASEGSKPARSVSVLLRGLPGRRESRGRPSAIPAT